MALNSSIVITGLSNYRGDSLSKAFIAHADWGSAPNKRWLCVAQRMSDGHFVVHAPEPVGEPATLIDRLKTRSSGSLFLGFDFPIGLPAAYAHRAGIEKFTDGLRQFGLRSFPDFFTPAETISEISLRRPFYPRRPGGTKRQHLVDALGVADFGELLRQCEVKNAHRSAACPLFWTLGPNQVGRAAISGWRDVLQPALQITWPDVALWPFDGDLFELLATRRVVIAETYPAEACLHLGLPAPGRRWSKRSQSGRRSHSHRLHHWAQMRGVKLSRALSSLLKDGFGQFDDGEDPFDATVGLFSMLEVVLGHRAPGDPATLSVRNLEGWILGRPSTPAGWKWREQRHRTER